MTRPSDHRGIGLDRRKLEFNLEFNGPESRSVLMKGYNWTIVDNHGLSWIIVYHLGLSWTIEYYCRVQWTIVDYRGLLWTIVDNRGLS